MTGDVAKTALNGAQVKSAQEIAQAVAAGQMPRESGVRLLVLAFQLSPTEAEEIMGPSGTIAFTPTGADAAPVDVAPDSAATP